VQTIYKILPFITVAKKLFLKEDVLSSLKGDNSLLSKRDQEYLENSKRL
jgi:hypothetical protein